MNQSITTKPIETSKIAIKITPIINSDFTSSYFKAYATNNAYDENIIWEDMTKEILNKEPYFFKNKTFSNNENKVGISIKFIIEYLDSIKTIFANELSFIYDNTKVEFNNDGCILKEINTTDSFTINSTSNLYEYNLEFLVSNDLSEIVEVVV